MDAYLLLNQKRAVGERKLPVSLQQAHLSTEKHLKLRAKIPFGKN